MFSDKRLNIWESISDLMAGLMMIFLFTGLAFLLQLMIDEENRQKEVKNYKSKIYTDLRKAFTPEEIKLWGIEIDEKLSVTFKEPDVLFDVNQSTLKPRFQQILSDFIPRYFEVIRKPDNADKIAEIRIEGYASKEDGEDTNSDVSYFYNMKLSQDRARNVLQYIFWIWQVQGYKDWMRENIITNGYSYGKAKADGDKNYDRRVEFRIITIDEIRNKGDVNIEQVENAIANN